MAHDPGEQTSELCRSSVWVRGAFRLADGKRLTLTVRGEVYSARDQAHTEQDALASFTAGLMERWQTLPVTGKAARGILVEVLACGFG